MVISFDFVDQRHREGGGGGNVQWLCVLGPRDVAWPLTVRDVVD